MKQKGGYSEEYDTVLRILKKGDAAVTQIFSDEEVKLREAELALMQRLAAAGDRGDAAASAELEKVRAHLRAELPKSAFIEYLKKIGDKDMENEEIIKYILNARKGGKPLFSDENLLELFQHLNHHNMRPDIFVTDEGRAGHEDRTQLNLVLGGEGCCRHPNIDMNKEYIKTLLEENFDYSGQKIERSPLNVTPQTAFGQVGTGEACVLM